MGPPPDMDTWHWVNSSHQFVKETPAGHKWMKGWLWACEKGSSAVGAYRMKPTGQSNWKRPSRAKALQHRSMEKNWSSKVILPQREVEDVHSALWRTMRDWKQVRREWRNRQAAFSRRPVRRCLLWSSLSDHSSAVDSTSIAISRFDEKMDFSQAHFTGYNTSWDEPTFSGAQLFLQ